MKISKFCYEYTDKRNGCDLYDLFGEVKELGEAIFKLNSKEIKEEFHDVVCFTQIYLYYKYKIDGKLWKLGIPSYKKFARRKYVWNKIYQHVGLEKDISNFCGNYKRKDKVINHLSKFGIKELKALEAYEVIVR